MRTSGNIELSCLAGEARETEAYKENSLVRRADDRAGREQAGFTWVRIGRLPVACRLPWPDGVLRRQASRQYQKLTFLHGAEVLLVPSAFAMRTGEAHWELLLRCRAIETQCYVLAAAQVGRHNEDGNKRESWGHSLAIDPWGRTLVNMGTTKGLAVVEIDSELVRSTRENMPIDRHRRYDIYGDAPHAATGHGATRSSRDAEANQRTRMRVAGRAAEDGMFFG
ncbi:unnamed protein product [Prorocentrum cordatum]|uniref:CN hydrolase domain-containing protein n=1 Tax=Prorocentrum cordatum TaxID=2364126 RepID=A0ABN9V268_9DINO|nr:unnamed protein product [Polarella glacialis]